jgi:hypothetical protein
VVAAVAISVTNTADAINILRKFSGILMMLIRSFRMQIYKKTSSNCSCRSEICNWILNMMSILHSSSVLIRENTCFVMLEQELCDISFRSLKFLKIRLVNSDFLVCFEGMNPLFAYICLAKTSKKVNSISKTLIHIVSWRIIKCFSQQLSLL